MVCAQGWLLRREVRDLGLSLETVVALDRGYTVGTVGMHLAGTTLYGGSGASFATIQDEQNKRITGQNATVCVSMYVSSEPRSCIYARWGSSMISS